MGQGLNSNPKSEMHKCDCGTVFFRWADLGGSKRKTCDRCQERMRLEKQRRKDASRRSRRPGETHKWNGSPYRRHVKEQCERCGYVCMDLCEMDVDHIDEDRSNNDPDNLRTLCACCHRIRHKLPDLFQKTATLAGKGQSVRSKGVRRATSTPPHTHTPSTSATDTSAQQSATVGSQWATVSNSK